MPSRKSVPTLQELCLTYISSNIDIWCNEDDNPVARLPNIILDDICEYTMREKQNLRPNHLNAIIHKNTNHLNFERIVSKDVIHRAVELIANVCTNLTNLNLSECDINSDDLCQLMRSIPTVKYLDLYRTRTFDYVLGIVGQHCPNLLELDLRRNVVTDRGIEALCVPNNSQDGRQSAGRCRLINRLLVSFTHVTGKGGETALRNLPNLRYLECIDTLSVIEKLYNENNPNFQLKLENFPPSDNERITNSAINAGIALCKNVNKVSVHVSDRQNWLPKLADFSQLQDLTVRGGAALMPNRTLVSFDTDVIPILTAEIGKTLKRLRLTGCKEINLWDIGRYCSKLSKIDLSVNENYSTRTPSGLTSNSTKLFPKLRIIVINCYYGEDIPSSALEMLLSNSIGLECLKIVYCQTLTDPILQRVCDVNSFSELHTLYMIGCNNVHGSSVSLIASKSESIKRINCNGSGISASDIEELRNNVKENNFDLKVNEPVPIFQLTM